MAISSLAAARHPVLAGAAVHSTNNPEFLATWLARHEHATVFVTLDSLPKIEQTQHTPAPAPTFDLLIVDEAHRTAGSWDKDWTVLHDHTRIRADRRLYPDRHPLRMGPATSDRSTHHPPSAQAHRRHCSRMGRSCPRRLHGRHQNLRAPPAHLQPRGRHRGRSSRRLPAGRPHDHRHPAAHRAHHSRRARRLRPDRTPYHRTASGGSQSDERTRPSPRDRVLPAGRRRHRLRPPVPPHPAHPRRRATPRLDKRPGSPVDQRHPQSRPAPRHPHRLRHRRPRRTDQLPSTGGGHRPTGRRRSRLRRPHRQRPPHRPGPGPRAAQTPHPDHEDRQPGHPRLHPPRRRSHRPPRYPLRSALARHRSPAPPRPDHRRPGSPHHRQTPSRTGHPHAAGPPLPLRLHPRSRHHRPGNGPDRLARGQRNPLRPHAAQVLRPRPASTPNTSTCVSPPTTKTPTATGSAPSSPANAPPADKTSSPRTGSANSTRSA